MSWHYSQALVEEYLEDNCSDGKPFAPWSSLPSAPDDLCSVKMKDTCHHSPYGMMYVPLTDGPGGELLTWFLEASLAKISQLPGKGPALKEKEAGCGEKWQGSSMKYDPDSRSWKTHQHSLFGGLVEFSETWPRWGTMRNGECWGLPMWERHTNGKESGFWRTPAAQEPGVSAERLVPIEGGSPGGMNRHFDKHTGRMAQIGLAQQVSLRQMWPTPRACMTGAVTPERAKDKFNNLESVMAREIFPTPTNSMMTVGDMEQARFAGTDKRRPDYATANKNWPTPNANDNRDRGNLSNPCIKKRIARGKQVGLSMCVSEESGQLNPTWVEWLMGWPLGWTACEPLETGKCHNARLKHGEGF